MNGNYEWQRHQSKERFQKRVLESQQYRTNKHMNASPSVDSAKSIIRLPLRLVTALLSLVR